MANTEGHCIRCKFSAFPSDDIMFRFPATGNYLCLGCYERETGSHLDMPREVRRSTEAALREMEGK